jgi:hypothetical protein
MVQWYSTGLFVMQKVIGLSLLGYVLILIIGTLRKISKM